MLDSYLWWALECKRIIEYFSADLLSLRCSYFYPHNNSLLNRPQNNSYLTKFKLNFYPIKFQIYFSYALYITRKNYILVFIERILDFLATTIASIVPNKYMSNTPTIPCLRMYISTH